MSEKIPELERLGGIFIGVAICLSLLLGIVIGHQIVADDCAKLGGFYYGDQVFECKRTK